jgi:hypothetical protein
MLYQNAQGIHGLKRDEASHMSQDDCPHSRRLPPVGRIILVLVQEAV